MLLMLRGDSADGSGAESVRWSAHMAVDRESAVSRSTDTNGHRPLPVLRNLAAQYRRGAINNR